MTYSPAATSFVTSTGAIGGWSGTCIVNGASASASFWIGLSGQASCVAGTMLGTVNFAVPAWSVNFPSLSAVVTNTGGVINVEFAGASVMGGVSQIVGSAELVQALPSTQTCLNGGAVASTTWSGAIVFEDPVVETESS